MKTIQINNKHYQECDVVMLPTNQKAQIYLTKINKTLYLERELPRSAATFEERKLIPQHLYILSNEEIKEGDWFYYKHFGEDIISQAKETTDLVNLNKPDKYFKKIVATTNSLEIYTGEVVKSRYAIKTTMPQIPQLFIEYFISEYNKGNLISKVLVEVEFKKHELSVSNKIKSYKDGFIVKLNQNNEVSILIEQKQETVEEAAKIKRSDLYNSIYSIVKQIPRKNVEGDAMDAPSCAHELEQLFYEWQTKQSYNREEVITLFKKYIEDVNNPITSNFKGFDDWIKQNLK